jgi:hypothetical protein
VGTRPTVFLFNDTQIKWDGMVEDINNILNSGEVPNLFATDEKAEILDKTQTVAKSAGMAIKDWGPNETFAYFVEVRNQPHAAPRTYLVNQICRTLPFSSSSAVRLPPLPPPPPPPPLLLFSLVSE